MEAVITIDVLRRAGADETVASVEKQIAVDACHGVKIVIDALIADYADVTFDLISLPGGMPETTMEYAVVLVEPLHGNEKADEVSGPLVMRSNHGDEYTFRELNPVKWTVDGSPQIRVPLLMELRRWKLLSSLTCSDEQKLRWWWHLLKINSKFWLLEKLN